MDLDDRGSSLFGRLFGRELERGLSPELDPPELDGRFPLRTVPELPVFVDFGVVLTVPRDPVDDGVLTVVPRFVVLSVWVTVPRSRVPVDPPVTPLERPVWLTVRSVSRCTPLALGSARLRSRLTPLVRRPLCTSRSGFLWS